MYAHSGYVTSKTILRFILGVQKDPNDPQSPIRSEALPFNTCTSETKVTLCEYCTSMGDERTTTKQEKEGKCTNF